MTDVDSYKGKKKHGFFKKIKELKHKHDEPKMEISGPTDFKHESHIGWDPEKGFDIKNIPPEWKQLFQQAGIKKKELKNPETVQFIYSVIGQNINDQKSGLPPQQYTNQQAGSAGGAVLPPSQRARAPPPPPPGGSKVSAGGRQPPPKPGSEIRPLPQKQYHAQTSKPLPPQPGQINKQMAQQLPPGQYQQQQQPQPQQRKPLTPQQQQQPPATNIRGNLPTTIGGKAIPVTMLRPGGDTFVSPPQGVKKQPAQQPQQLQQPQYNNEPLIQQEVKGSYVLDEPLQPTQKRQSPAQQPQQPQQPQPQETQQNYTTTINPDGSQTFVYKPQQESHQYTYQSSKQQQGYNSYYSTSTPQQQQYQSPQQQQYQSPQQQNIQQQPTPIRTVSRGKLPTPVQQRKVTSPPTQRQAPPLPTTKRPPVQPPVRTTTSPTQIQPPIIQRTVATPPIQTSPAVTVTEKYEDNIMPPPPPPMSDNLAHLIPEKVDPKSPLPPPPKNAANVPPPVSISSPPIPQESISIPTTTPPAPPIPPPAPPKSSTPISNSGDNIPPQSEARSDLMSSIRNFGGTNGQLKKVTPGEPLPDLKELQLGESGNRSLVDTLAAAMAQRRGNLGEDSDDDDDDSDWEHD